MKSLQPLSSRKTRIIPLFKQPNLSASSRLVQVLVQNQLKPYTSASVSANINHKQKH